MKNIFLFLLLFLSFFLVSSETVYSSTITGGYFYDGFSIEPGKSGLKPGVAASSTNFTNNTKGITGVKINFDNIGSLSLTDFEFNFGNTNVTNSWPQMFLSNPSLSINSNEATIVWDNPILVDGWLELTYANQYLYFGNLAGDASLDGFITPIDALSVINHINGGGAYNYQYDINGDGDNTSIDALIIINRLNSGDNGTSITLGPFEQISSGSPTPIRLPNDPNFFPYQNIMYDLVFDNQTYALASTPVPEPTAISLLGAGILGLTVFRRKYRKQ